MTLAFVVVVPLLLHLRHARLPARRRVWLVMNVFAGVTIGTMAFGHLLAVTTKLWLGTLAGSARGLLHDRHCARSAVVVAHRALAASGG